jgi:plastocyanin
MAFSANPRGRRIFSRYVFALALLLPGLFFDNSSAARHHTIQLTGDASNGRYRFSPQRLTAERGDSLVFVVESGGPHTLGLDPAGLPQAVRDAWNRAMPRRTGPFRSPLLRSGQPYTVVVSREIPPGQYSFFCLAHRAYDMRIQVEIKK